MALSICLLVYLPRWKDQLVGFVAAWPPMPHFHLQTPHLYRLALGQPGPQHLTSIDKILHLYQPDPSLLSAMPGRQLGSDLNLSVDRCSIKNPCIIKIDIAISLVVYRLAFMFGCNGRCADQLVRLFLPGGWISL